MVGIIEDPAKREDLDVIMEKFGGEDAGIKARDKFRRVSQAALKKFQDEIIELAPSGFIPIHSWEKMKAEIEDATLEYHRVIEQING